MRFPWHHIGTWSAALVLLLGCRSTSKPDPRPGMVYIPAGEFLMGSAANDPAVYDWERPHEQPQHPVWVDGFYIDVHEVTNAEFDRIMPGHQRHEASSCDDCPVTQVSWFSADAYCRKQTPPKRLPTEAEWEKAAKGGLATWAPDPLEGYAWDARETITRAQPVATKKPNPFGLYDMLGNVREWTADWYAPDYYQQREYKNPKGPPTGKRRVERGGAFFLPRRGVTATIRYNHPPTITLYFLGFRCAQDP